MMNTRFSLLLIRSIIVVGILNCSAVYSQWSTDPNFNNPVSVAAYDQGFSKIASDGKGGAIITWCGTVSGGDYDIYAQKITSQGETVWTDGGIIICSADDDQLYPEIISDGAGGAIIAWQDYRGAGVISDLYAQRVNSAGEIQWTSDGIPLCVLINNQLSPLLVPDGSGGAIIAWKDFRNDEYDIYAQRVNSLGSIQWTENGVALSVAANDQQYPAITGDGSGGAIVTWEDNRNGSHIDIYAQKINGAGAVQWMENGVPICTSPKYQYAPVITSDYAGGAIIAWEDYREDLNLADIYAQRINTDGIAQWDSQGVTVSSGDGYQAYPVIMNDNNGGLFISWVDTRGGTPYDIYIQKIMLNGAPVWTEHGIAVCTASSIQFYPTLASDGAGGAILTWQDNRNGMYRDIYAQRVSVAGATQWMADGVPITLAENEQFSPTIVPDELGGGVIAWYDYRSGASSDIYAQNVDRNGFLGNTTPLITSLLDVASDQGGSMNIAWSKSCLDRDSARVVASYALWKNDSGFWEKIAEIPAVSANVYSYSVTTSEDSTADGTPFIKLYVSAKNEDSSLTWDSKTDSGYSVDNLAPSAPLSLSAQIESGTSVIVHWDRNTVDPDVEGYEIHRSTTSGFLPAAGTAIGLTSDTAFTDTSPVTGASNYYKVLTVDIHDNRSQPSVEAMAILEGVFQYAVRNNWNIISVPLTVPDYAKSTLYPTATSNAFGYSTGYVSYSTLTNGKAYWMKFSSDQQVTMQGMLRSADTVTIVAGWNMVGSISAPVAVGTIISDPPGIQLSQFFGYNNGYFHSATVEPGKGYWVKANQSGKIILKSGSAKTPAGTTITIVETTEIPPPPPGMSDDVMLLPEQFSLSQNYPNPFNPATTISYALPDVDKNGNTAYHVTLKIFNVLGEVVATVIDGVQEPGFKTETWDATGVPSGVYFYRLTAGTFTATKTLLITK